MGQVHLEVDLPEAFDQLRVGVVTGADLPRVRFVDAEFEERDGSPVVIDVDLLGARKEGGAGHPAGPLSAARLRHLAGPRLVRPVRPSARVGRCPPGGADARRPSASERSQELRCHSRLASSASPAQRWGGVLLIWGDDLWRSVERRTPSRTERRVTQVLGVRHLTQGLAQLAAPDALRLPVVLVDVSHAVTMLPLVALDPRRRRAALLSGAVALASAARPPRSPRTGSAGRHRAR